MPTQFVKHRFFGSSSSDYRHQVIVRCRTAFSLNERMFLEKRGGGSKGDETNVETSILNQIIAISLSGGIANGFIRPGPNKDRNQGPVSALRRFMEDRFPVGVPNRRIRAESDQRLRHGPVAETDPLMKNRFAKKIDGVHVRPRPNQKGDDFRPVIFETIMERRLSVDIPRVDGDPPFDEKPDQIDGTFRRRRVKNPLSSILDPNIDAKLDKIIAQLDFVIPTGVRQTREIGIDRNVRIGPMFDEKSDHLPQAVLDGDSKGGPSVGRLGVRIGAKPDKESNRLFSRPFNGDVKRRPAGMVRRVDFSPRFRQKPKGRAMIFRRRDVKRSSPLGVRSVDVRPVSNQSGESFGIVPPRRAVKDYFTVFAHLVSSYSDRRFKIG